MFMFNIYIKKIPPKVIRTYNALNLYEEIM